MNIESEKRKMFVEVEAVETLPDRVVYVLIFDDASCSGCHSHGDNRTMTTQGEIFCSNCIADREPLTFSLFKEEPKEQKIMRLKAAGYSTREIAFEVGLSQSAIQYQLHKQNESK